MQVAAGLPSSLNDGFSCANGPFPNLAPLAYDDSFSTPFNTAVTGNVTSNNGNGADKDPEGTALTVTTAPVVAPTHGAVMLAANGAFTYTPAASYFGTDTFTYKVSDAAGLTATAVVTITIAPPVANLVTVKTRASATGTPGVGQTVVFSIIVTNNGPDAVPNPSLTDLTPAGLTYAGHTVSQGSYFAGTGLWTIGALANGANAALTISATVNAGQEGNAITNTATAAIGGNTDLTTVGDDLTEQITVNKASLRIAKTANKAGPVSVGTVITYTYDVTNNGNVSVSTVSVNDTHNATGTLPQPGSETLFLDAAPVGDSTDVSPSNNVWSVIGPGDTVRFKTAYTVQQSDIDLLQ